MAHRKAPWEGRRPLLQASWSLIRDRANAGESLAPPELREALRQLDAVWQTDELSVAGDLSKYVKSRMIEMRSEIRDAPPQEAANLRAEKRDLARLMGTVYRLFCAIYDEHHPLPEHD